tara:strand:+ start:522 stop:680 length:159 start_codon:yes stop_codon:yes gene_type:complete
MSKEGDKYVNSFYDRSQSKYKRPSKIQSKIKNIPILGRTLGKILPKKRGGKI